MNNTNTHGAERIKEYFRSFSSPDMLHGPILKSLIIFAVPIFLSLLLQNLYNTVDSMIVGHLLGDSALAAVGIGGVITELLIGFATGAGMGMSMILAQRYGADDTEGIKRSAAASIIIGAVLSLLTTLIGLFFLKDILILLNTPEELLTDTYNYAHVIIMGIIACYFYNLFCGMLKALGNSFTPLLYLLFSSILNAGLDLLFVAVLDRGVQGSAEATVISQMISAILCGIYIIRKARILIPKKHHFRQSPKAYLHMAWMGISLGLMSAIVTIGTVILQYAINSLETPTITAHTAARRLFSYGTMLVNALAHAISMFVSQNFGAKQYDRMRKALHSCFIFDFLYAIAITALYWTLAEPAMRFLTGSDNEYIIETGVRYLRFVAPFYLILGLLSQSRMALQGLGQKILPMISSIIELIGKIIFTCIFVPRFGYSAVIVCEPIIWCFMAAQLLISLYLQPQMRKKRPETKCSQAAVR